MIISAKYDDVFRGLLHNPIVLKHFISDVMGIPLHKIRSVRLRNTFLWKRHRKERLGILDVALELNDDTKVDIEMQVKVYDSWDKRQLFYLSKLFVEDLMTGEDYSLLKKCVGISILDFNLTNREKYHTVYHLRDEEGNKLSDILELHVIELKKKLTGQGEIDDWIRLFNAKTKEDLEMIKTRNPGILAAIRELERMSLNNPLRVRYEAYLKKMRDERAWRIRVWKEANSEGRARGLEEGKLQGLEEGKAEGKAEAILDLLREHGDVPESLELRILSERDGDKLRRWLSLAAKSRSVDEFQKQISELSPLGAKNSD